MGIWGYRLHEADIQIKSKVEIPGHKETKHTGQKVKGNKGMNSLKEQTTGYVPIQIINISLEEVELQTRTYVGTASFIQDLDQDDSQIQCAYVVQNQERNEKDHRGFGEYLNSKLRHLSKED
jgi:hypothetical protein